MKREKGLPAGSVAGFSLIELMVAIAILCILMGLADPGFATWLPNYRLKCAARDLYSNLQLAKSGAIKDRTEWAIRFTSPSSYEIWSARDPDTPNANAGWNSFSTSDDTLIKTVDLSGIGSGVEFGTGNSRFPRAWIEASRDGELNIGERLFGDVLPEPFGEISTETVLWISSARTFPILDLS